MENLVESEQLILDLTPHAGRLGQALLNLQLPDYQSSDLFEPDFRVESTIESGTDEERHLLPGFNEVSLPTGSSTLQEWFLEGIVFYEHARVYFERGNLADSSRTVFESDMGIEALARADSSAGSPWISTSGKMHVTWHRNPAVGDGESPWKIATWKQKSLHRQVVPQRLFDEVLAEALPDSRELARARESLHEQNIVKLFTTDRYTVTKQIQADYQDLESTYQHPALSVVDIDDDGFDDLYVTDRWGPNQLLHNQGDGTFTDIAPELGLAIEGFCNAALFADFDNDGDQDVFIGRSLERSLFLRNENGHFVDRSSEILPFPLPYLVSTISAADYNNDGLLDVYLGLYGPSGNEFKVEDWAADFFPGQKGMQQELVKRFADEHRYLNRLGPPNMLLTNRGAGKFSVRAEAEALAEWHNTYQSSWADFDDDGDVDLYVCNDFAPDHLYRNDGPAPGNGPQRFVEVSTEMAGNAMSGFGMGASWGDYDRDGQLDLYVSNMFSKAGRRITSQLEGLDARVPHAAQGSLLFHNEGAKFEQVAGVNAPAMQVAKVGWSYGGQFVDVDNDGWLDIYASSGYYTAPAEIANNQDL
ncbi:MAG: VCBS repeat-containing protein [Verrucomicrobiales bacterium]